MIVTCKIIKLATLKTRGYENKYQHFHILLNLRICAHPRLLYYDVRSEMAVINTLYSVIKRKDFIVDILRKNFKRVLSKIFLYRMIAKIISDSFTVLHFVFSKFPTMISSVIRLAQCILFIVQRDFFQWVIFETEACYIFFFSSLLLSTYIDKLNHIL